METLLEKISQYDLFINLIPGYICYYFLLMAGYSLPVDDIFDKLIFCYVAGILIGRIGSLIVEPTCKAVGLVRFAPYPAYLAASREDNTIPILSGINNLYRNLLSVALIISIYVFMQNSYLAGSVVLLDLFILVLLVVAYHKQTGYVRHRVENVLEAHHEEG